VRNQRRGNHAGLPTDELQRLRARSRFAELHLLTVTDRDLDDMVADIRSGRATLIERQSNRVTVWDVDFLDQPRRVVYDQKRHTIVTVLPRPAEANT
jgi:hypothetical protein